MVLGDHRGQPQAVSVHRDRTTTLETHIVSCRKRTAKDDLRNLSLHPNTSRRAQHNQKRLYSPGSIEDTYSTPSAAPSRSSRRTLRRLFFCTTDPSSGSPFTLRSTLRILIKCIPFHQDYAWVVYILSLFFFHILPEPRGCIYVTLDVSHTSHVYDHACYGNGQT